jgi:hypothetical protein
MWDCDAVNVGFEDARILAEDFSNLGGRTVSLLDYLLPQ